MSLSEPAGYAEHAVPLASPLARTSVASTLGGRPDGAPSPATCPLLGPDRIAEVCKGRVLQGGQAAASVSTDSRKMRPGACFVALRGKNFDGHDFAAEALAGGAAGLILDQSSAPERDLGPGFIVLVADTGEALLRLAASHRQEMGARFIGITGSCGKTSTKDMLFHVLSPAMRTVASPQSFNNHVGVPLSLFEVKESTQVAILEIGSSSPGEIAISSRVVMPDLAIVTCIEEAHLAGLGTIRGVSREKSALLQVLDHDGLALLNGDDAACLALADHTRARTKCVRIDREADWFATNVRFGGSGTTFRLQGERPVTLPRLGSHNVYNALFTIAAAVEIGMDIEAVLQNLRGLPASSRRLECKVFDKITLLDDTYNMNPASARAALLVLSGLQGRGRRIAVFGEMLELGESSERLHEKLGRVVADCGVDLLVTVGARARAIGRGARAGGMQASAVRQVEDPLEARDLLIGDLRPFDLVLCKASRLVGLDRLVDELEARIGGAAKPA